MVGYLRERPAICLFDMLVMEPKLLDYYTLDSRIPRSEMNTHIRAKLGNRFPLHTRCDIFIFQINDWFDTHKYQISHLLDTMEYEYNPIENYNRHEEGTRHYEYEGTSKETEGTANRTDSSGGISTTVGQTTKSYESAFNQLADDEFTPVTQSDTKTESNGDTSSISEFSQDVDTSGETGGKNDTKYENFMHGNIGVMSTQDMIQKERNIVVFNIFEWITDHIDNELFLGIL